MWSLRAHPGWKRRDLPAPGGDRGDGRPREDGREQGRRER
ncbi:hypothetical protein FHS13_003884 [Nocardiopsis algeriensis]|uniref:Uncharacterized protein n=1 Tax=Nocardiopsis algeriensis TaxID=1478215 RepID=A0A841IZM8_9ACTN|nr:hypothetical protein [Nocardiopsis algeriensis]